MTKAIKPQTIKRFGKYVDSIESSRKIMKLIGIDKELIYKWTHKVKHKDKPSGKEL